MPTQNQLKDRVKQYRLQRRLTQQELADRLRVNVRTIKRLEAGEPVAQQTMHDVERIISRKPVNLLPAESVR